MRAQITLTPNESKKLISKAVVKLDVVQKALKKGIVAIHPSSTTVFIIEELTGKIPDGLWMCGMIVPRGTCLEGEVLEGMRERRASTDPSIIAGDFRHLWVLKKGSLQRNRKLNAVAREMDVDDVYIKAANAIDPERNAGILLASVAGGTVARFMGYAYGKGFNVIIPVGLEKLIPTQIREAVKEAGVKKMNYAMVIPVGLYPMSGTTITEIEAFKILTGATATPIAAGGVGGAEGAITFVIRGDDKQVKTSIELIEGIRGSMLPAIHFADCLTCPFQSCHLREKSQTRSTSNNEKQIDSVDN